VGLTLNGPVEVKLIEWPAGSGIYDPQAGDTFELVEVGEFVVKGIPPIIPDINYQVGSVARGEAMKLILPELSDGLVWEYPSWVDAPYGDVAGQTFDSLTLTVVPEPGTLLLSVTGGLALLLWRRRKA